MNKLEERRADKRQADIFSLRSLADLLREIIATPQSHLTDESLKKALSSQGAMAKYTRPDLLIIAMCLNHQRQIAEIVFGNFGVLDELRSSAKDALTAEHVKIGRGNVKTREGLRSRIHELEVNQALLLNDLAILQRAYDLRCLQARNYASANPVTQALCAKEQKEIDASFSLRRKPIGEGKVVEITEVRKRAQAQK